MSSGATPTQRGVVNYYVPLPNGVTAKGQPQSTTQAPQPRDDRNVLIRMDFVATTHHTVDARYNLIDASDATSPGVNSQSQGVPTFEVTSNHAVSNYGNIGDTWVISSSLLNVARIGYKRYALVNPPIDPNTWNTFGGNFTEPGTPVMPVISDSGAYKLGSTNQASANVIKKLTLNLGARYELPFQWYQPNGYASTFLPGHQSTVFPGAIGGLAFPGDQGVLKSLVPTDFNGIVPRFGFAYDVFGTGRLAIRGGFGMFFDAINADVIGVGEPFYFQYFNQIPVGGTSVPLQFNAIVPTSATQPAPDAQPARVIPSGYNKTNPQFTAPYTLFYPDRNFRTPYYESTNLGFQYRVVRGGVLDVNYVGKFGRKLTIPFDQNPAIYDCSGGYFQANPNLYCNGASNAPQSTEARLRYTPFNYGGTGLVDFASIDAT